MVLIEEAITINDSAGHSALIDGYSCVVDWVTLTQLRLRLIFGLYLVTLALAYFDRGPLRRWDVAIRLLTAVLLLLKNRNVDVGRSGASCRAEWTARSHHMQLRRLFKLSCVNTQHHQSRPQ
jgi:hypothetical protein